MVRDPKALAATMALALAGLVVVVSAASSPVVAKGIRRAKKAAPLPSIVASAPSAPPASSSPVVVVAPVATPSAPASAAPSIEPPRPKISVGAGTRVLVVGDSFADSGFSQRLKVLVEERGGKFFHDAWTSSTTKSWATQDRLGKLLAGTKADVVFVTVGANEVFLPAPENIAPFVKAIAAKIAPRACAWSSPPLWKGETGIVAVERANASPCAFFDASPLKLEKRSDGIHPSLKGGAAWADAFWAANVAPAPAPSAPSAP